MAESATMAQQNHRNDRSLEMEFVESFCVTPVMPQNTSASMANPSQICMYDFSLLSGVANQVLNR
jgi:hypothetical protein